MRVLKIYEGGMEVFAHSKVGFHGDHMITGQRRCGLYLTPTGDVNAPTTRLSPVYFFLMFNAPTASLCHSKPQSVHLKFLVDVLCFAPQTGHVCEV
jgi:hypothetical protein